MLMDWGILTGIAGLIVGVFGALTPWIYERLDAFHFHAHDGRKVAGEYISAYSDPDAADQDCPVTWEKITLRQSGRKIWATSSPMTNSFSYELKGMIYQDIIVGYWFSVQPHQSVHGSAYLSITPRGNLVGIWAGDTKSKKRTCGWWILAKDKGGADRFVRKMQSKSDFKTVDLLEYLEE